MTKSYNQNILPRPKAGFHQTVRNIASNRQHLGLSLTAVEYLRRAAECVSPDDLQDGRTPWCYERVDDMALALGVTPRSIHTIEKQLAVAGLIVRAPMTNGHRGARRCYKTGELLWAHGISLLPLVTRQDELAALERNRLDRERTYRVTRQRVHGLRGRLKDRLTLALEFPVLAALCAQMWAIYDASPSRVTRALFDLDDLTRVQAELSLALDTLIEALDEAERPAPKPMENPGKAVDTSDAPEAECRHKYLTTPLDLYSCSRAEPPNGSALSETGDPDHAVSGLEVKDASGEIGRNPKNQPVAQISPRKLLDLAPDRWRSALGEMKQLDWTVIGFVADARRAELGVSGAAWQAGVARMGVKQAALCLAVLDTNREHPTTPVRSVGGAFVAMTRRAEAGTLNLEPSVAWIAARRAGVVPARAEA